MEIIIVIAVFGFMLWWVFLRTPADTTTTVYKVETPPTVEPIVEEVKQTVEIVEGTITPIAAVTTVVVEEAVAVAEVVAPAKKPRKPRAPKVEATPVKVVAKKAAPKKAAAIKAAPKTRSKKI